MNFPRAGAVLFLLALLLPTTALAQGEKASAGADMVEVTADSPPEVLLAFNDLGSLKVPRVVVEEYGRELRKLTMRCQWNRKTLANLAQNSTRWLEEHAGREFSNLQFLKKLRSSVRSDPLNAEPDCRRLSLSLVINLGGQALEQGEVERLKNMMNQLATMSGGG